ncbi:MAG: putative lipoprotein [Gammaproteobacteria bacterium]|nr:putative lipoprotein [Gammaproteobacteria bacterium]
MVYARILTTAVAWAVLGLAGCGGDVGVGVGVGLGNSAPPTIVTHIYSDPQFDGDIEQTAPNTSTITQGMSPTVQSVLVGIDPVALTEFRAFLDFPLGGPGGVPGNAVIDSAFLEVFIDDLQSSGGSLPVLVDLVSFQPPTLVATDFDRAQQPPLASTRISPPISHSDVGAYVTVDVTSLVAEAQRLGLPDFQVRIMEDLGPAIPALMAIDDTTGANRAARAPVLTVTYY